MNPQRITALVCGLVCIICIFVAVERYQDNVAKVEAMNQFGGGIVRAFNGGARMRPTAPAATKYAVFFAVLAGVGALAFAIAGARHTARVSSERAAF